MEINPITNLLALTEKEIKIGMFNSLPPNATAVPWTIKRALSLWEFKRMDVVCYSPTQTKCERRKPFFIHLKKKQKTLTPNWRRMQKILIWIDDAQEIRLCSKNLVGYTKIPNSTACSRKSVISMQVVHQQNTNPDISGRFLKIIIMFVSK